MQKWDKSTAVSAFYALIAFTILVSAVECGSNQEYKVVDTNNGQVRGVRKSTLFQNVDYYAFKGIPYAKPPTGELRLKPPEPVDSWSPKVLNAFKHGPVCTQTKTDNVSYSESQSEDCLFLNEYVPGIPYARNPVDELRFKALEPALKTSKIHDAFEHRPICIQSTKPFQNTQFLQSEDCLFLNIYVPADLNPNEKLPVLFFIHGGGYLLGSGNDDMYGSDFLIEQRVILVTINYRLGVFGFLSLGLRDYSGNMGLKDQQLALKWVHSNIEQFAGDNRRITIVGESAGGSCVHFHILSRKSRKYFSNAIVMSGTANNHWAFFQKDFSNLAHQIAEDLNETKTSNEALIDFLKTVPADKIVNYAAMDGISLRTLQLSIGPVIERSDAIRPFIVKLPNEIYDEAEIAVDAMFSFCSAESIAAYTKQNMEIYDINSLNSNFTIFLPFKGANLTIFSPEYQNIAKEIREFYFKDEVIDEKMLKPYIDLLSDINFAYGIDRSAKQHAKKTNSKTFYYLFSVDSKLNVIKHSSAAANVTGTSHADDLCYLFRCEVTQQIYDEILKNPHEAQSQVSLKAIENITKLFANFAKYGEPTHGGQPIADFLPIQNDKVNFLDVTNDGLKLGINPNQGQTSYGLE